MRAVEAIKILESLDPNHEVTLTIDKQKIPKFNSTPTPTESLWHYPEYINFWKTTPVSREIHTNIH
jgi:hypothetical protein